MKRAQEYERSKRNWELSIEESEKRNGERRSREATVEKREEKRDKRGEKVRATSFEKKHLGNIEGEKSSKRRRK